MAAANASGTVETGATGTAVRGRREVREARVVARGEAGGSAGREKPREVWRVWRRVWMWMAGGRGGYSG